jgi:hypothetical protein
MTTQRNNIEGTMILAELREFAGFTAAEQRYIRRSLDVAYNRCDAIALWSRDKKEAASIAIQKRVYKSLDAVRKLAPDDDGLENLPGFIGGVIAIAAFDLDQGRINSFAAFRFLYERLFGASSRPWLPAIYCGTASLPHLVPARRRELLSAISEAAATAPGWSEREPCFIPERIEAASFADC